MLDRPFHSLTLAEAPVTDDEISAPFPVLEAGTFRQSGKPMTVTEEQLDAMVENFGRMNGLGTEVSIDYDHSFAEGGDSKAAGWIKDLYRSGKQLMARVKWTPRAAQMIRDGEFRYVSAEYHTDWADQEGKKWGPTLLASGLTNRPFLKTLGAVALSERTRDAVAADVDEMRAALDEVATHVAERRPVPKSNDNPTEPVTLAEGTEVKLGDETIVLTEEQLQRLTTEPEEGAVELREEIRALSDRVTAAEKRATDSETQLLHERRDADLAQARREGRIKADDETTTRWHERYEKFGRDEARALLFELPAETIPMTERGHGVDKPVEGEAPEGVDPQAYRVHKLAEQIAAEKNIDYADAAQIAFTEVHG